MVSGAQAATMFDQLAIVEETMRVKGWNPRVAEELAVRLGVTRRTVYNIRSRAIQWTKRQLRTEDIEARRAEQYQLADEAARSALAKGDYAGVASLLKVQASLTGTIAPTNVNVNHTTTVSPAMAVRLSGLSVTELQQIAQKPDEPVIDAQFEPVSVKDGGERG